MADESLREEIHNLAEAVNALRTTIAVSESERATQRRDHDALAAGIAIDRDSLRSWKNDSFYPLRDDVNGLKKWLDIRVLALMILVVSGLAGFAGGMARELCMYLIHKIGG